MDSIQNSIDALAASFASRLAAVEDRLQKVSPEKVPSVNSIAADFKQLQAFVVSSFSNIQKQLSLLTNECDNMEMRSRRKMLLFHGVPDAKDGDTVEVVTGVINKHLSSLCLQPEHISRVHRMGRLSPNKPRPILVKFSSVQVRDEVWFSKTGLKGTGVTVSEFLTKRRHRIFVAAREKLGISKCWTSGGRIVALGDDGKRHSITSLEDLERFPAVNRAQTVELQQRKPVGVVKVAANSAGRSESRPRRDHTRK